MRLNKIWAPVLVALFLSAMTICTAGATTWGSPIKNGHYVDCAYQISVINRVDAAPVSGKLDTWYLYAVGVGEVSLQVYRPVTGGFILVGQNDVLISGGWGSRTISVAEADQISVQAGDLLGFRYNYDSADRRIISYNNDQGPYTYSGWPDYSTNIPVGGFISDATLNAGGGRTYSLAANVSTTVPEPNAILLAGPALGLFGMLRRRLR